MLSEINNNNLFIENFNSESDSENDINIFKSTSIIPNKKITTITATNGINVIQNISKPRNNIKNKKDSDSISSDTFTDSSSDEPKQNINNNSTFNFISDNGWNQETTNTIKNWYHLFKQQSFIYQYILDNNIKIGNKLILGSVVASSLLGVFSGFKIWKDDNDYFQQISNVILMLSNFSISFITGVSKIYIDDKRNEQIRIYIEEVDNFLGSIIVQLLNDSSHRINAEQFFKENNILYSKLLTNAPNISLKELNNGKKAYLEFNKNKLDNIV